MLTMHAQAIGAIALLGLSIVSPAAAQDGRRVQVAEAVESTVTRDLDFVGTLEPLSQATLRSRVDGYVVEVPFDIGDEVVAGAVLARIDVPEHAAQAAVLAAMESESAAAVMGAEAAIADAEALVVERQAAVNAAEAAVALAQSQQDAAAAAIPVRERTCRRVELLHQKGSATAEALDEAESRLILARAAEATTAAAKAMAQAQAAAAAARVPSASAKVRAAEAAKASAETHLAVQKARSAAHQIRAGFAELRAPYERCVVTKRYLDPGALVKATETMLITVADVSSMRLRLALPENLIEHVRIGSKVQVRLDALPGSVIDATVSRLGGGLNPGSHTLPVEVRLDNKDGRLLPGMYAHLSLRLAPAAAGIAIPGGAVLTTPDGDTFVFVVTDGRAVRTDVVLGLDDGARVQVTSGLGAGARVVLGRPAGMRDGDPVTAVEKEEQR